MVRWWPHTDDPNVASFRLRCLRIVEHLAALGVDAALHDPSRDERPQLLVLSKRYDANSLAAAVALRERCGTRLLLDLCDNHFDVDNVEPRWLERAEALRAAVRRVDRVTAASEALAAIIRAQCPEQRHIDVIGDASEPPVEPQGWKRWRHPKDEIALALLASRLKRSGVPRARRLLWFGNHGSAGAEGGMSDLLRIRDALERAHRIAPLSLTVISNDARKYGAITTGWTLPTFYLRWRPNTFSRAARLHGATVIPVSLNPFTVCKSNNRVASAFLHGLNVIADGIPSYREFEDCAVLDDWTRGLGPYLADERRRHADVVGGQRRVLERYSLEVVAGRWRELIAQTASTEATTLGDNT